MTETIDVPLGIVCREEFEVRDEHTAKHIGSGDVEVLSTPSMILFMEMTALHCVQGYLPEDYTTVGTLVNVKHLNPAPKNSKIVIEAKLVGRDGRRLVFEVKALWRDVVIGEGIHERYVVNRQKFLEKVRKLIQQQ